MSSPITRPTFRCEVGGDGAGNWRIVVPAAPDLGPVLVSGRESVVRVGELLRLLISDHFDIPAETVRIDLGRW